MSVPPSTQEAQQEWDQVAHLEAAAKGQEARPGSDPFPFHRDPWYAKATVLTVVFLPLLGLPVIMVSLGGLVHRRSQAIQAHFSELTSHAHENLSGVRVVRAYRQEEAETAHFLGLSEEYLQKNLGLARVQGLFFPLLTSMGGLSAVVVLYVGGQQVMAGQVTVGEFVAFGVYLAMLVWPMIALGWAVNLVQRGAASTRTSRAPGSPRA